MTPAKTITGRLLIWGVITLGIVGTTPVIAGDNNAFSRPHGFANTFGSKFYLGANLGLGFANYKEVNDSASAYSLFGGYHINDALDIDMGWANMGDPSGSLFKSDTSLMHLGMLGKVPLRTDLTLYGKIGLAMWNYDMSKPFSDNFDASTDTFFGFGADYGISDQSSVRFGLDFYRTKPDFSLSMDKEKISKFSVDLLFKP
jgi:hypothetical protein